MVSFGPKLNIQSKTQSRMNSLNRELRIEESESDLQTKPSVMSVRAPAIISPRITEYTRYRNQDKLERQQKCIEIGQISTKQRMKQVTTNEE